MIMLYAAFFCFKVKGHVFVVLCCVLCVNVENMIISYMKSLKQMSLDNI